ncbi:MAG: hypothetical protein ACI4TR_05200, partial [Bacteroidaceae bacterium]
MGFTLDLTTFFKFTLAEAAKATGRSAAEILDAVTHGRISGVKDMLGVWHVERAGLMHVFPPPEAEASEAGTGDERPLDAVTLVLEVGISILVR